MRPAVAQDGGDITFRGYENGTVFLHMKGACAGCPSSTATLKHGIQNLLRHFVPEVQQVEQVAPDRLPSSQHDSEHKQKTGLKCPVFCLGRPCCRDGPLCYLTMTLAPTSARL